jgi:glycosyltransferase involved in cell wall biosynthesis
MITVVIPTLDQEEALAQTLASLVPAAADGTVREVVVADGGSRDGTRRVADMTGCTIVEAPGPLGARLRAGAEAATRGDWLLFLQPGVELDPRWEVEATTFVERAVRAGRAEETAAVFRFALDGLGAGARLQEGLAALSATVGGLPRPAQGLLIKRSHYRRVGGHAPLPALADADLVRRIGRRRIVRLRSAATLMPPSFDVPVETGLPVRRTLARSLAALPLPVGLLVRLHG